MTDIHPDLAGLAASPLEPHERMDAAAARLRNVAGLSGAVPWPMRHAFGGAAAVLETTARLHRESGDGRCAEERRGRACVLVQIADALLGNPT